MPFFVRFFFVFFCVWSVGFGPYAQGGAWAGPGGEEATKKPPVDVIANSLVHDPKTQRTTAQGDVVVTYGAYRLRAHNVTYNARSGEVEADGDVVVLEPNGQVLRAANAQMTEDFKEGFARHVHILLTNDATIRARYVTRKEGRLTIFEQARYTRCTACRLNDNTPLWEIRSEKATNNEDEKRVFHTNMTFMALGVPIAWLPYFSHPSPGVKNASGFLAPKIRYSNVYGMSAEIPYFWSIDPSYDFLFMPQFTWRNGTVLKGEWRQRLAQGTYLIRGAGLYQLSGQDLPDPGNERWRWYVQSIGAFHLSKDWSWGWDVTGMSDDTFMRRYDLDDRTEIESTVYLSGFWDRESWLFTLSHYQGLLEVDKADYSPLLVPYISHSSVLDTPVLGGALHFDQSFYGVFRKKSFSPYPGVNLGTQQALVTGSARWQREWVSEEGIEITPFAELRADGYVSQNVPSAPSDTQLMGRLVPAAGADLRWSWVRAQAGEGEHMLTPVVQVVGRVPSVGHDQIGNEDAISINFDMKSLFLDDRMTGFDRVDGGVFTNAGVLYQFDASSERRFSLSFGQSFAFIPEDTHPPLSGLDGSFSDLVAAFSFQPFGGLMAYGQVRIEDRLRHIHTLEAGLTVAHAGLKADVNYAYLRAEPTQGRLVDAEQIRISGQYQFYEGWSVFGGLRYDFKNRQIIKGVGGIQYLCECSTIRLSYQEDTSEDRDAKNNRSIVLSIELKTLGGTRISPDL